MFSTPRRVWLIDGNEHRRFEAEFALDGSGISVDSGGNLQAFSGFERPDLVILGCNRPGDGETQAIHHFVELNIPVVVLASRISEGEIRELFHAGATDASTRPGSLEKLQQLIRSSMEALFRRTSRAEKAFTVPTL